MPEKLKEMQDIFYAEAKKFDVLPLDNSTLARFLTPRPSATAGRTTFTYSGELTGVPASAAPSILQKSYTVTAEVEIPEGGAEGMIVTQGGRFGGYGLFLSKGEFGVGRSKPVFLYNLLDLKRTAWEGPELEAGKHTIVFDFKFDGGGFGKGGTGVLIVDGKEVDKKSMENTTPIMFPEDEDFDIGQDTRTPVALIEYRYDCPFKFTGKINKLTFDLGPAHTQMRIASNFEQLPTESPAPKTSGLSPDEETAASCRRGRSGHRRGVTGCSVARRTAVAGRRTCWGFHSGGSYGRHSFDCIGRRLLAGSGDGRHVDLQRAHYALSSVSWHPRGMGRAVVVAGSSRPRRPDGAAGPPMVQAAPEFAPVIEQCTEPYWRQRLPYPGYISAWAAGIAKSAAADISPLWTPTRDSGNANSRLRSCGGCRRPSRQSLFRWDQALVPPTVVPDYRDIEQRQ